MSESYIFSCETVTHHLNFVVKINLVHKSLNTNLMLIITIVVVVFVLVLFIVNILISLHHRFVKL